MILPRSAPRQYERGNVLRRRHALQSTEVTAFNRAEERHLDVADQRAGDLLDVERRATRGEGVEEEPRLERRERVGRKGLNLRQ